MQTSSKITGIKEGTACVTRVKLVVSYSVLKQSEQLKIFPNKLQASSNATSCKLLVPKEHKIYRVVFYFLRATKSIALYVG